MSGPRAATHPAVLDRRRRVARSKGRRRRSWLLGALAAVTVLLGAWFLVTGPLLAVHSVRMRGYERDDAAELHAALASAAENGTALRPAVGDIRRAAAAFPWVESVRVKRDLPRGVVVTVTQAESFAIARSPKRPPMVVSAEGRVLERAQGRPALPAVRLLKPVPEPGERLPAAATAALGFLAASEDGVTARVRGLGLRGGQLRGALADGPKLRLGAPDRLVAKAAALQAVLDQLSADEERAATYIDLSVPERPAVGGLGPPPTPDDETIE
jgi:cell division protein FtsQ